MRTRSIGVLTIVTSVALSASYGTAQTILLSPGDFSPDATRIKLESVLGPTFEGPIGNALASFGVVFDGGFAGDFSSDGCPQVDVAAGRDGSAFTAVDSPGGSRLVPITNEVTVRFVDPVTGAPAVTTAFGAFVGSLISRGAEGEPPSGIVAEVTLKAFDISGNHVGAVTSSASSASRNPAFPVGDFLGIGFAGGIHRVLLTNDPSTDGFAMGDFFVTVSRPAPSCTFGDDFVFEPPSPGVLRVAIDIKPGSFPNSDHPQNGCLAYHERRY